MSRAPSLDHSIQPATSSYSSSQLNEADGSSGRYEQSSRRSSGFQPRPTQDTIARMRGWLMSPLSWRRSTTNYHAISTHENDHDRASATPVDFQHMHVVTGPSTILATLNAVACYSWSNVLLIFVPIAIASYLVKANPAIIFMSNIVAIIPLSGLLTHATENIARQSGDAVGALVNITFGNLVEVLMFVALVHNQLRVVQASLLGSILVNLLLVLGSAIIVGSWRHQEQLHSRDEAQALACLLCVSVFSLLIPNAFYHSFEDTKLAEAAVLKLSRGTAVVLLIVYILYIFLQMKLKFNPVSRFPRTSEALQEPLQNRNSTSLMELLLPRSIRFQDEESTHSTEPRTTTPPVQVELESFGNLSEPGAESDDAVDPAEVVELPSVEDQVRGRPFGKVGTGQSTGSKASIYSTQHRSELSGSRHSMQRRRSRCSFAASTASLPQLLVRSARNSFEIPHENPFEDEELYRIGRVASAILLVVSSLLVAVCAELLVNTIDEMVSSGPFSEPFIGLIILPIAGNCAEQITAMTVAAKNNLSLAIGVSVGSSIQIALFVTPLVVLTGWALDRDMTMYFSLFETVTLVATAFLVNFLILNGRSNFLEGSLLCSCYLIIAFGAYLFPN